MLSEVPPSPRRLPRSALIKVALLVAFLVAGFLVVRYTPLADQFTEEKMVAFLGALRGAWWTPLLLVVLYVVCSSSGIPVTPLMIAGAGVYGFFVGSLFNILGLIAGGLASFWVAKLLGRDLVEHYAGRRLRQAERLFERHGFWPLVQTRFLPIPFTVVNFAAALAGVRTPQYIAATLVGLIPATLIHTYFMSALFTTRGHQRAVAGVAYVAVLLGFNLVISLPSIRSRLRRRERYREILARRQGRGAEKEW